MLPILYLRGVSMGDFQEALAAPAGQGRSKPLAVSAGVKVVLKSQRSPKVSRILSMSFRFVRCGPEAAGNSVLPLGADEVNRTIATILPSGGIESSTAGSTGRASPIIWFRQQSTPAGATQTASRSRDAV